MLELVEQIGRPAEETKRPGIAEPLPLLEAADKQALVAANRDRLARLLLDLASLVATAHQHGWALVASTAPPSRRRPKKRTRTCSPASPPSSGS